MLSGKCVFCQLHIGKVAAAMTEYNSIMACEISAADTGSMVCSDLRRDGGHDAATLFCNLLGGRTTF